MSSSPPTTPSNSAMRLPTALSHLGRASQAHAGFVNLPTYRGSTVLFPDLETLDRKKGSASGYGRSTSPLQEALKETLVALEGGTGCVLTSSGLEAVTLPMLALLQHGKRILISDGAYSPTIAFAENFLPKLGIKSTRYDPTDTAQLQALLEKHDDVKVLLIESPSSQSFEMTDLPAVVALARKHGVQTIADNTWGAGIAMRPLEMGVDVVVQSGTKYVCGHSDAMLGFCVVKEERILQTLEKTHRMLGIYNAADEVALCLRGIRTLPVRYEAHRLAGLKVCDYLKTQPEVSSIIHPALASHPQHALWQRDCSSACGLFAFTLEKKDEGNNARARLALLTDRLRFFGMGMSWGGYESLLLPMAERGLGRQCLPDIPPNRWMIRLHIGLEDTADLIQDLDDAFRRYRKAG